MCETMKDYLDGTFAREEKETDICPVCREAPTSRANRLHGNVLLPCPTCSERIEEGRERILEAMQTVARGSAFANQCARAAARDILTDTFQRIREER